MKNRRHSAKTLPWTCAENVRARVPVLLGEVFFVAVYQSGDVVWEEVDFALNVLGLAGGEASEAKVGVETAGDALEEFLIGIPSGGEDGFFVGIEATNEAARWDKVAERARVDICAGDVFWAPNLAGNVARFFRPRRKGHAGELVIDEDETFGQVVVEIAFLKFRIEASESAETDAGLRPVGFGSLVCRVACDELEGDFISACRDGVIDDDAVLQCVAELHYFSVFAEGNEFVAVLDDGVLYPVCIRGSGAAVGFEIVDSNLTSGDNWFADDEPVVVTLECDVGVNWLANECEEKKKVADHWMGWRWMISSHD